MARSTQKVFKPVKCSHLIGEANQDVHKLTAKHYGKNGDLSTPISIMVLANGLRLTGTKQCLVAFEKEPEKAVKRYIRASSSRLNRYLKSQHQWEKYINLTYDLCFLIDSSLVPTTVSKKKYSLKSKSAVYELAKVAMEEEPCLFKNRNDLVDFFTDTGLIKTKRTKKQLKKHATEAQKQSSAHWWEQLAIALKERLIAYATAIYTGFKKVVQSI